MDYDTDAADINILLEGSLFTEDDGQALEERLQPHLRVESSIVLYSVPAGELPPDVVLQIRYFVLPLTSILMNLVSQALYDTIKARFLALRTADLDVTVEVEAVDENEDVLFTRRVRVRAEGLNVKGRDAVDAITEVVKHVNAAALSPSDDD